MIAIESKIIDIVVDGIKSYKTVFIISDHIEEIRQFIIVDLERGGTCFKGKGLYKGNEREMIYTTITRNEFVKLRSKIYDIDPNAFINVTNSSETIGEGFKALEKD